MKRKILAIALAVFVVVYVCFRLVMSHTAASKKNEAEQADPTSYEYWFREPDLSNGDGEPEEIALFDTVVTVRGIGA